jgi:hypothetical protein
MSSTILALKTRPRAQPGRSPGREFLAQAVVKRDAAAAEVDKLVKIHADTDERRFRTFLALGTAQEELAEAKRLQAVNATARMLGEPVEGPNAHDMALEVERLEREHAELRLATAGLEKRRDDAKTSLEYAELSIARAVHDAVTAETDVLERFVADFLRQAEGYAKVEATALWLERNYLPKHLGSVVKHASQGRERAKPDVRWWNR